MKRTFVQAMFGDDRVERRALVCTQLESAATAEFRPEPLVLYTFGEENDALARRLGHQTIMLDSRPVVDFLESGERQPDPRANQNFGCAIWWHKIAAMREAMRSHDEIVWLDLDCRLQKPLPGDFWERLRRGAAFQGTLVEYRNIQCWWRTEDRRKLSEGACWYCRDAALLERIWEKYREWPTQVDQEVVAMVLDEEDGGWQGLERWKALGRELYCHRVAGIHNVLPCEELVFYTARSKPSPTKHLR
mgnify:FL=1